MNQLEGRKLKISVVTPSHNRLEYLKVAVMSVQVNVLAPLDIEFEHIIHDCGSTDGTKDYFITNLPPERIFYIKDRGDNKESTKDRQWIQATEDLRKDGKGELADNIIFIRSEHKVPPSQARNICIQKSTGQFLCVLVCKIIKEKKRFNNSVRFSCRMMMMYFFNVQFIILLMLFYKIQQKNFLFRIFFVLMKIFNI